MFRQLDNLFPVGSGKTARGDGGNLFCRESSSRQSAQNFKCSFRWQTRARHKLTFQSGQGGRNLVADSFTDIVPANIRNADRLYNTGSLLLTFLLTLLLSLLR